MKVQPNFELHHNLYIIALTEKKNMNKTNNKKHVRFTKGHTEDVGENLNILEELPSGGKQNVVWCSRHGNFILS